MTISTDVRGLGRPSPAGRIALAVLLLIDVLAVLALVGVLWDGGTIDGGVVVCLAILLGIVAFVVGAVHMARRGRMVAAIWLAVVPAVPALLLGGATILFVATFHHQP